MMIEPATVGDVYDVAMNMRERDREELSALYPVEQREDLAIILSERYGGRDEVMVAYDDDGPIAFGGVFELRPNVLTILFVATDDFPSIVLPLTRLIKRRIFPPMIAAGAHRIEATSLSSHRDMHRWLEVLGLKKEAEHRCYGKRRETFITFAWVVDARKTSH